LFKNSTVARNKMTKVQGGCGTPTRIGSGHTDVRIYDQYGEELFVVYHPLPEVVIRP